MTVTRRDYSNLYSASGQYPPALLKLAVSVTDRGQDILGRWDHYTKHIPHPSFDDFCQRYGYSPAVN